MARKGRKPRVLRIDAQSGWDGFVLPGEVSDTVRNEFSRLRASLEARELLAKADPQLVLAAARQVEVIERAAKAIAKPTTKLTRPCGNGITMAHPMLGVMDKATARLARLLNDLGLTPKSSRYAGNVAKKSSDDWDDLLDVVG